jgi:hypothetical protein
MTSGEVEELADLVALHDPAAADQIKASHADGSVTFVHFESPDKGEHEGVVGVMNAREQVIGIAKNRTMQSRAGTLYHEWQHMVRRKGGPGYSHGYSASDESTNCREWEVMENQLEALCAMAEYSAANPEKKPKWTAVNCSEFRRQWSAAFEHYVYCYGFPEFPLDPPCIPEGC